jgi:uncharacterized phage infection (PIP) family protein YhgE
MKKVYRGGLLLAISGAAIMVQSAHAQQVVDIANKAATVTQGVTDIIQQINSIEYSVRLGINGIEKTINEIKDEAKQIKSNNPEVIMAQLFAMAGTISKSTDALIPFLQQIEQLMHTIAAKFIDPFDRVAGAKALQASEKLAQVYREVHDVTNSLTILLNQLENESIQMYKEIRGASDEINKIF